MDGFCTVSVANPHLFARNGFCYGFCTVSVRFLSNTSFRESDLHLHGLCMHYLSFLIGNPIQKFTFRSLATSPHIRPLGHLIALRKEPQA